MESTKTIIIGLVVSYHHISMGADWKMTVRVNGSSLSGHYGVQDHQQAIAKSLPAQPET